MDKKGEIESTFSFSTMMTVENTDKFIMRLIIPIKSKLVGTYLPHELASLSILA